MLTAHPLHHLQAVHIRHHQIEKHERNLIAARTREKIECGLSTGRGHNRHARARDGGLEQTALHGIVVNDEDCLRHVLPVPFAH